MGRDSRGTAQGELVEHIVSTKKEMDCIVFHVFNVLSLFLNALVSSAGLLPSFPLGSGVYSISICCCCCCCCYLLLVLPCQL